MRRQEVPSSGPLPQLGQSLHRPSPLTREPGLEGLRTPVLETPSTTERAVNVMSDVPGETEAVGCRTGVAEPCVPTSTVQGSEIVGNGVGLKEGPGKGRRTDPTTVPLWSDGTGHRGSPETTHQRHHCKSVVQIRPHDRNRCTGVGCGGGEIDGRGGEESVPLICAGILLASVLLPLSDSGTLRSYLTNHRSR